MNWIKMDNTVGTAQEQLRNWHYNKPCCLPAVRTGPYTCLDCFSVSWHSLGTLSSNERQKNAAVVCFWSFSTGIISLDMSWIKYDLQSCSTTSVLLSRTLRHHFTVWTVYSETLHFPPSILFLWARVLPVAHFCFHVVSSQAKRRAVCLSDSN